MGEHCPCCLGYKVDVYPVQLCPGLPDIEAEVARLTEALEESRAELAKRAKVRVSVHDVWLRERILREQAEATIADLRAEVARLTKELDDLKLELETTQNALHGR